MKMKKEDFYQSKPFTSRLGPDTQAKLKAYCKREGLTLWRYLDVIIRDALDKGRAA